MAEKLGLDNEVHELILGTSFLKGAPEAYHSIRYDFKPASVDMTQVANVDIGEGNSVMVTVPHVEGSGTTHTVYKGNKRPCQKECVLIIDHQTGQITLEKLGTNIHLKKTRQEGSSKASQLQRPHTPTEKPKEVKSSPPKKKKLSPPGASQLTNQPAIISDTPMVAAHKTIANSQQRASPSVELMSSSSDSNTSSSESEDDSPPKASGGSTLPTSQTSNQSQKGDNYHMLTMDLQLSESGSDSD